jgi:hypothetical protein
MPARARGGSNAREPHRHRTCSPTWIRTQNIWVSTGAHIVNDWLRLSLSLLGAGLAIEA